MEAGESEESGEGRTADIAVIGAGPAGLHAALKAALLFHTSVVFDKGPKHSRIFFAPKIDNIPGFPDGIRGSELLKAQRRHIAAFQEEQGRPFVEFVEPSEVLTLRREGEDGLFVIRARGFPDGPEVHWRTRAVVLATGVVDRQPYIGDWSKQDMRPILPYANKGTANYCMLCDAHTVSGKTVAVLSADSHAVGLATTLRDHFGARPTVVGCIRCALKEEHGAGETHEELTAAAKEAGVPLLLGGIAKLHGIRDGQLGITMDDGTVQEFDKAFLSFGFWKMNTELAVQMGAALDPAGYVRTTGDCEVRTEGGGSVAGLFAIGDIRSNTWNQIPVALGDAETAVIHAFAEHL
jgi:thioredoxin reductase (NADPH)